MEFATSDVFVADISSWRERERDTAVFCNAAKLFKYCQYIKIRKLYVQIVYILRVHSLWNQVCLYGSVGNYLGRFFLLLDTEW